MVELSCEPTCPFTWAFVFERGQSSRPAAATATAASAEETRTRFIECLQDRAPGRRAPATVRCRPAYAKAGAVRRLGSVTRPVVRSTLASAQQGPQHAA